MVRQPIADHDLLRIAHPEGSVPARRLRLIRDTHPSLVSGIRVDLELSHLGTLDRRVLLRRVPLAGAKLEPLDNRSRTWLLASCPIVSLIPPVIYLAIVGEDRQMSFDGVDFWKQFFNEFVMRTPLFWLPHFLMGMLVARAGI